MKRRLIAGVLVIALGLTACVSDEAVKAIATSETTTTAIETTTAQITAPETTTLITSTTATKRIVPEILISIDDVYIHAAYKDKKYTPVSHAFIDLNSDGFDDVVIFAENEEETLLYGYTYTGTEYIYIRNSTMPLQSFKYNPDIFDNINNKKPFTLGEEIKALDFEYNGKTIKTVLLSMKGKYDNLNYIAEIVFDENKRPLFVPILAWGLGTHFSAGGDIIYATYRGNFGSYLNDYDNISAKRFHELTDEYFEENKDYVTFIPPDYDIENIIQNSISINDLLYYYDDYSTVYLIREGKIIDTFSGWISEGFFYSSDEEFATPLEFDIPPHFEYKYKMYNVFNDKISEVKFIVDGKNIYDLEPSPEFLHFVMKTGDRSFVVYFMDLFNYSLGINGKVEFTYNPENNCFEGEHKYNESPEAEKLISDLYKKADELDSMISTVMPAPTDYQLSGSNDQLRNHDFVVKFDDYPHANYSRGATVGFRNRKDFMAQLNEIFSPECSEEIYKIWTDKSEHYPLIYEHEDELYFLLIEGGDGGWGNWYFDIISITEETIEARIAWIEYRSASPYYNHIRPINIIITKTENGYRISQNPFISSYEHFWN
jgi:hypothetical protein